MALLYAYICPSCGAKTDQWHSIADRDQPDLCECGATPRRNLSSATFYLDGLMDPDFPTAHDKHMKDRERRMAKEEKNLKDNGEEYPNGH